jgi:hypothetical protein
MREVGKYHGIQEAHAEVGKSLSGEASQGITALQGPAAESTVFSAAPAYTELVRPSVSVREAPHTPISQPQGGQPETRYALWKRVPQGRTNR